jgi:hypothetical protein
LDSFSQPIKTQEKQYKYIFNQSARSLRLPALLTLSLFQNGGRRAIGNWSLFDDVFSQNVDDLVDKELQEVIVRFPEVCSENLTVMREGNINKNTKKKYLDMDQSVWRMIFMIIGLIHMI